MRKRYAKVKLINRDEATVCMGCSCCGCIVLFAGVAFAFAVFYLGGLVLRAWGLL